MGKCPESGLQLRTEGMLLTQNTVSQHMKMHQHSHR